MKKFKSVVCGVYLLILCCWFPLLAKIWTDCVHKALYLYTYVTKEQVHTPQGNSLWIQSCPRYFMVEILYSYFWSSFCKSYTKISFKFLTSNVLLALYKFRINNCSNKKQEYFYDSEINPIYAPYVQIVVTVQILPQFNCTSKTFIKT